MADAAMGSSSGISSSANFQTRSAGGGESNSNSSGKGDCRGITAEALTAVKLRSTSAKNGGAGASNGAAGIGNGGALGSQKGVRFDVNSKPDFGQKSAAAENRNPPPPPPPPSSGVPDFDSDLKAAIARRRTKMDRQPDGSPLKGVGDTKLGSHVVFSSEIGGRIAPVHVSNSDSKLLKKGSTGNSPPHQRIGLSLKESVQNNINGHHQQAAAAQLQQNYNNHLVSTSTNGSGMNSKKDSG